MFGIFRRKREEKERAKKYAEVQTALKAKEVEAEATRDFYALKAVESKRKKYTDLRKKIDSLTRQPDIASPITTDSCGSVGGSGMLAERGINLPVSVYDWYSSQGYIGDIANAILAQNWLIDKCCRMPGDDAVMGGYELLGENQEAIDALTEFNKKIDVNKSMREYINLGRVFGIRVALFVVDSLDADYYENPFNIDGVREGSYKGISQIDPNWVMPDPTTSNLSDPASLNFYDPTYYLIQGKRYHKSHLCVYIPFPVADVLKPCYRYGGKSLPQMLFSAVYGADRSFDELPMLLMTKRLNALQVSEAALSNPEGLKERLDYATDFRDNFGYLVHGAEEVITQFDTSLADSSDTVMTTVQRCSAISMIPGTKLLGTQPKGFNSTGDYELQCYRQVVGDIQANPATQLLAKSNQIALKSLGYEDEEIEILWQPLDQPTEEQRATIEKTNMDTIAVGIQNGVIDGEDGRNILSNDKDSKFFGIKETDEEAYIDEEAHEMGEPEDDTSDI